MAHPKGERILRFCPVCGQVYEVNPTRLKWGRGTTCSRRCSYILRGHKSEHNIRRVCIHCGRIFAIAAAKLKEERGLGQYCSRECRDAHRIGPAHPQYINGLHQHRYGPHWYATRRAVVKRDNHTCQHCGRTDGYMHVHHIRPFRLFASADEANQMSNLITLCGACHRRAEAELQREARCA